MKTRTIEIVIVIALIFGGLIITILKIKRVTPLSWSHHLINQPIFSNQAINGYDPVAFFIDKKAIIGSESITYNLENAVWYFSSESNKQLFIEKPDNYIPQFGGYCSFAVSKGFTANSDPNTFEIIDDRLYFFADEGMKSNWMENQEENMQRSISNWR